MSLSLSFSPPFLSSTGISPDWPQPPAIGKIKVIKEKLLVSIFISFLLLNDVFCWNSDGHAPCVYQDTAINTVVRTFTRLFVCYSRVNWLKLSRRAAAGRLLSAFIKLVDDSNSKARKLTRLQLFFPPFFCQPWLVKLHNLGLISLVWLRAALRPFFLANHSR